MVIINKSIEENLWTPMAVLSGNIDHWNNLAQYAVSRFATFIGDTVRAEAVQEILDGNAICIEITKVAPAPSRLSLQWTGTFSISATEVEVSISATIFAFIGVQRVVCPDRGGDYLWYKYVRGIDGFGRWDEGQWVEDEYDEFVSERMPVATCADEQPSDIQLADSRWYIHDPE